MTLDRFLKGGWAASRNDMVPMESFVNRTIGYGTQSGVTQSVSQPTSGLLMLVGLAGLALRRRRA